MEFNTDKLPEDIGQLRRIVYWADLLSENEEGLIADFSLPEESVMGNEEQKNVVLYRSKIAELMKPDTTHGMLMRDAYLLAFLERGELINQDDAMNIYNVAYIRIKSPLAKIIAEGFYKRLKAIIEKDPYIRGDISAEGPFKNSRKNDNADLMEEVGLEINLPHIFNLLQKIGNNKPLRKFLMRMLLILKTSRIKQSLGHAERVLHWLLEEYPEYEDDIPMQVAVIGHDLDRTRAKWKGLQRGDVGHNEYEEAKTQVHPMQAAQAVSFCLQKDALIPDDTERVQELIKKHHSPVSSDSKAILLADAIAFMEYNLPYYFEQEIHGRKGKKSGVTIAKIKSIVSQANRSGKIGIFIKRVCEFLSTFNNLHYPRCTLNKNQWDQLCLLIQEQLPKPKQLP